MIGKYTNKIKGTRRRQTPETWISGPDPIEHEKYYAWLKHRAQAKFRNEEYSLTWEDWDELWPKDLFVKRGRGVDDLCVSIVNLDHGWHKWNVTVCTRREQLARNKEYRK